MPKVPVATSKRSLNFKEDKDVKRAKIETQNLPIIIIGTAIVNRYE
ncbi:11274_t:CDS:2 [Paraglomus occultum]|uniref:11274_t:CDS:1 n=1 Tax=Paraglomus occultum TaxID=144539 RepID=A0A9N9EW27_9GLOM|nr:11274_t:CDS:2 [Paraglomus occultum]